MNIQEEEKQEEEKQVQKEDKQEIEEEEEEEDFIPFTKEKPVKQEDNLVYIIYTAFSVPSNKRKKHHLCDELQVISH